MENIELKKQYSHLTRLIKETNTSTGGNLELQGHWGRYLCVLVSGFLENAIRSVYTDFVSQVDDPHIIQYIQKSLKRIHNPKAGRFIEIANQFKEDWGKELEQHFKDHPENKEAIDSIMNTRNLVAHGQDSDISVNRVRGYLENSVKVIEFIENQCANRISA